MRDRFDRLVTAPARFRQTRPSAAGGRSIIAFRKGAQVNAGYDHTAFRLVVHQTPQTSGALGSPQITSVRPKLFHLTKRSFLALFDRPEIAEEDLSVFGEWLAVIMLANQAREAGYPITKTEARSALRSAGVRALPGVSHRLAIEMESTKPDEKIAHWHNVVGPVFKSIWPLDAELQSPSSTFKLRLQILRATGDAFQKAADAIIPFIRSEDPRRHTSVHSISRADDAIYACVSRENDQSCRGRCGRCTPRKCLRPSESAGPNS